MSADPRPAYTFSPLAFEVRPAGEMRARAEAFLAEIATRRSVREFASDPVPLDVIDTCLRAAGTAPSGAHRQPWTFVVVTDPTTKRAIRAAAETEERANYAERMGEEWLEALAPLGTTWEKPFLETAPALIAVFRHAFGYGHARESRSEVDPEDPEATSKNYYVQESVGIACGFLLAALHHAGLATLTHTPSPMGFLQRILGRPSNEKAYLLIPVGYPAPGCRVPDLERKPLDAIRVRR